MAISGRTKILSLDPSIKAAAEWALGVADYYSVPVTVVSGRRTMEEQRRLRRNFEQCVATGRFPSPPDCKFPANRPGESAHNFGLAFDSVVEDRYMEWWTHVRELVGFRVISGDAPHAEYPNWRATV